MRGLEAKARELTDLILQLTHQITIRESEILQNWDVELTLPEFKVIHFLNRRGPSIMREIADHLGMAVSTMTGIIDRMVKKNLVVRERPEDDRRIVKVELTEQGRQAEDWHMSEHKRITIAILKRLNEEDQDALLDIMKKVVQFDLNTNHHDRRPTEPVDETPR
jgi:DNA-binding MarR family transcriptional regulator